LLSLSGALETRCAAQVVDSVLLVMSFVYVPETLTIPPDKRPKLVKTPQIPHFFDSFICR
jgi:hypothetical protein